MRSGFLRIALAGLVATGLALPVLQAGEGCGGCPMAEAMKKAAAQKAQPCPTGESCGAQENAGTLAVMKVTRGDRVSYHVMPAKAGCSAGEESCCAVTGVKKSVVKTFPNTEEGKKQADAYVKELKAKESNTKSGTNEAGKS